MRPRIRFGRHREAHSQYRLWDQEGKIYDDCNQHICSGYPSPGCPTVPHLQRGAVGPNAKTPIPTCPSSRGFPISSAGLFGRNFCSAIWLLVFLFPMPARAQEVAVTAEADPNPVGVDDQLSLTITINSPGGGAERPQIPKIDGLKLVGGPSVSNQFQWINGQSSSSQSFTYALLPEKEGSFKIPPISVKVGGKSYHTQELVVKVVKDSVAGRSGAPRRRGLPSIFDDMGLDEDSPLRDRTPRRGDVLTTAEVDKKTAFVGEQITLTYKILTQLPIAQVEIKESPTLKGFWVEEVELPKNPIPQGRNLNGKQYTEYTIKKQALFPTTAGTIPIPTSTFALVVRTSSGGFFSLGTQQTVFRKTDPLSIKVNPLPEVGRAADFTGAVGSFKMETSVDKSKAEVGQAINLKVVLSGSGNFRTITDFPLPELPGFKIYSSKSNDNVGVRNNVLQGSKTWEYVVIPQVPGKELIPEMKFSYFSPDAKQYREARTAALEVAVLKGKGATSGELGQVAFAQQGLVKRGSDVNYIKLSKEPLKDRSRHLYQSSWIYLALFLPMFFNGGLLVYSSQRARLRQDLKGFRSRQARKVAEKRLAEAKKCLNNNQLNQFHGILEASITGYLSDKFDLPQIEITSQQIKRFMQERSINSHLSEDVTALLEECNFARYAPVKLERSNLEALFQKARNAIIQIEKEA
ncbi:MAG: hypothetical protein DMG06_09910 [Acidobacteria bacterium]|nr:MAG: hypothetical protein DMG06_09910 [Acidobacteriota bacterium]